MHGGCISSDQWTVTFSNLMFWVMGFCFDSLWQIPYILLFIYLFIDIFFFKWQFACFSCLHSTTMSMMSTEREWFWVKAHSEWCTPVETSVTRSDWPSKKYQRETAGQKNSHCGVFLFFVFLVITGEQCCNTHGWMNHFYCCLPQ